jgi:hypothetical protein
MMAVKKKKTEANVVLKKLLTQLEAFFPGRRWL